MITIYTTKTCQYCGPLKAWLKKQNYAYEEKDLIEYAWEVKKYTDSFSPPISIVKGQPVQGLNYMRIKKLMGDD